ncbi:MAG: hypothetical protein ACOVK5_04605 [Ilumatobacteraceae bacterium]
MSLSSESIATVESEVATATSIEGKSPRQLAWLRFRKDRLAFVAAGVIAFYVLAALFAPVICAVLGISPYTLDGQALNDYGLPNGPFGGISTAHWLGVEPGTGRDILARLLYGARVSLGVGFVGTMLATSIGVALGVVAG